VGPTLGSFIHQTCMMSFICCKRQFDVEIGTIGLLTLDCLPTTSITELIHHFKMAKTSQYHD
jgi:hypothetical protein